MTSPEGEHRPGDEPGPRRIAELEAELARVSERLHSLESSTSLRVGRLVVQAARSPRAALRLPIDLLRIARRRPQRGTGRASGGVEVPVRGVAMQSDPERRRFLAYSGITIGPRDRLSAAVIATPETIDAIAGHAIVNTVLPHDGQLVVELVVPDLLLVETAAFRPGLPWAFTGDPSAVDRQRSMLAILATSQRLGCPAVLWRNTADHESVALGPLESRFTLLVPGEAGSPLADWSLRGDSSTTRGMLERLAQELRLPRGGASEAAFRSSRLEDVDEAAG